jgi:hypothetical protein
MKETTLIPIRASFARVEHPTEIFILIDNNPSQVRQGLSQITNSMGKKTFASMTAMPCSELHAQLGLEAATTSHHGIAFSHNHFRTWASVVFTNSWFLP